jgi:hypothetical protein
MISSMGMCTDGSCIARCCGHGRCRWASLAGVVVMNVSRMLPLRPDTPHREEAVKQLEEAVGDVEGGDDG